MITPEHQARIDRWITSMRNRADELQAGLTKAGFSVNRLVRSLNTNGEVIALQVESAQLENWTRWVNVSVAFPRWTNEPKGVEVEVQLGGYRRGSKRRYTKMDEIVVKVVDLLLEKLEDGIRFAQAQKTMATARADWAKRRADALKGVVLPPGLTVEIVQGDGPEAGTFQIDLESTYNYSVKQANFTAEQVRELVSLLNRFMQPEGLLWLSGELPDEGDDKGGKYVYHRGSYWVRDEREDEPLYFTAEEAADIIVDAQKKFKGTIQARKYAERNTI